MTQPINLHPLTLAEAQELLAKTHYRTDWSVAELIEAASNLTGDEQAVLPLALRIVASAELTEAHHLKQGGFH